jgi:hypothetical protein
MVDSGSGAGFSEYFGFYCQFSFYRLLHTHHLSSWAGTMCQLMADVPSGPSLTPLQETKKLTSVYRDYFSVSATNRYWERSTLSVLALDKEVEILFNMEFFHGGD